MNSLNLASEERPPEEQFPNEHYPIVPLNHSSPSPYHISKDLKYLGEMLVDLPDNCIFNKGSLGSGGTSLALSNHINYIIAVPYKAIAESKLSLDFGHEILFVKSGVYADEIEGYLRRNTGRVKKIFVTYDALDRLVKVVDPKDYKLLVDEFHALLLNYEFRNKAIRSVLNNIKYFNNIVLMSGTPILNNDFILHELIGIRLVTCIWDCPKRIDLQLLNCINSVEASLTNFIIKHLKENKKENLYIFVNSIEFITKVINHPSLIDILNDTNCKAVHAEDKAKKTRIKRSVITDLGSTKINFITSTAFEGADIIDELGQTVIAIDANIDHMKMDISTTLYQVCGRIRNARNSNVDLFCKFIDKKYIDYDTYKFDLINEYKSVQKLLNTINSLPENERRLIRRDSFVDPQFIIEEDGKLSIDKNYQPIKLWRYSMNDQMYTNMDTFSKSILNSSYFNLKSIIIVEDKNEFESRRNYSSSLKNVIYQLKDLLSIQDKYERKTEYGTSSQTTLSFEDKRFIDDSLKKFPYIWDALKYIGVDKMEKMNFNTRNIKNKLMKYALHNQSTKIVNLLLEMGVQGNTYSLKEIKRKLISIYKKLDIKTTAKATDIEKFFICEKTTKIIEGKRTKCFALLEPHLVVSN